MRRSARSRRSSRLKQQRVPLPRCVILIEASEESGSIHLPEHLRALGENLGQPSLVVCLDAEAGNYDQVWCTTSLRGNLVGELRVRMLTEGVHSGMGTGIAATPFRVAQQLLARLENPVNGDILIEDLQVAVPPDRRAQITAAAKVLGDAVARKVPFAQGVQPLSNDPAELLINTTWRATLAVTGADGPAAHAERGQRAAAGSDSEAVASTAAHHRSRRRRQGGESRARARPALWRAS